MATSTTTIRQITTMCDVSVPESDRCGIFSFRDVYNAYLNCRRRKRNTINALRFEADILENLFSLSESLCTGNYQPLRSVYFITQKPKLREIFAADFRDRVVHHLLVPRLERIFEPKFIYDSYACRKEKGTHAAVNRLKLFMNKITRGRRVAAWFIQLDISSFFMSIDRTILLDKIEKHVKDKIIMDLTRRIINHDCTEKYVYKGNPGLQKKVPLNKSLFFIPPNKGLPIGNLTSQFFANVYLNELDQYVKHELKAKYYLRYVDDFILLHSSKVKLLEMRDNIKNFLSKKLLLSLKPEFAIKRVSEGSNFLGYIIRPDYVLVRNRVIRNLKTKLCYFKRKIIVEGKIGKKRYVITHLRENVVHKLRQILASYLGHFKHADSHTLIQSIFEKYTFLKNIFSINNGYRLVPLYEPDFKPHHLSSQYGWFIDRYKEYCIFFQVGNYIEFYGLQAQKFAGLFDLKVRNGIRGMGKQSGFPIKMLKRFKSKMLRARQPYIVVAESGFYRTGLKRRIITEVLIFSTT